MALEGRMRDLALSDVFQLLEFSRKTGTLTVRSELGDRTVTLRFDRGDIVGAEAADEAVPTAIPPQVRAEGGLAVEPSAPPPEPSARSRRVEELAASLLHWSDGYFRFVETEPGAETGGSVRIPAHAVLIGAARRADAAAPPTAPASVHLDAVPSLAPGLFGTAALHLDPDQWSLLSAIDGRRTVGEILATLGGGAGAATPVLDRLVEAGLVFMAEAAHAVEEAPAERAIDAALLHVESLLRERASTEARRRIEVMLAEHPDLALVRVAAGRVLLLDRHWHEAAEQLSRAVRLDPLCGEAHYFHGLAAARAGDLPRAVQAWTTFLRLPGAPPTRAAAVRRALEGVTSLQRVLDREFE